MFKFKLCRNYVVLAIHRRLSIHKTNKKIATFQKAVTQISLTLKVGTLIKLRRYYFRSVGGGVPRNRLPLERCALLIQIHTTPPCWKEYRGGIQLFFENEESSRNGIIGTVSFFVLKFDRGDRVFFFFFFNRRFIIVSVKTSIFIYLFFIMLN